MWRGLLATAGDLVALLDADTEDPTPADLLGIVGPHGYIKLVREELSPLFPTQGRRRHGGCMAETSRRCLGMCRSDLGGGRVVFSSPPGNESAARRGLLEKMPTFRLGYDVGSQRLWTRAVRQDSRPWRKWASAPRRLPVMVSAVLQIAQRRLDPAGALWTMLYLPWTKETSGVFRFLFLRGCRLRRWAWIRSQQDQYQARKSWSF